MKALVAVLALATLSGCRMATYVNPVYQEESECVRDFPLAGVWASDEDVYKVTANGASFTIAEADGEKFTGHLVRIQDKVMLDLEPEKTPTLAVPTHLLARVWMEGDILCLTLFDSDWLLGQIGPGAIVEGHDPLITLKTPAIRALVEKHGGDARAWSEVVRFKRQ